MERPSEAELARVRAEHRRSDAPENTRQYVDGPFCSACMSVVYWLSGEVQHVSWPCDAARLLAELDHREANPPRWQGRDHLSPVPHLAKFAGRAWAEQPVTGAQHARWMAEHDAGVAAGLFGPSTSEELPAC